MKSAADSAKRAVALVGWLAVFCSGCGPSGQVRTYPVKGKVMFEGKPMVGGGGISLVPMSNVSGKAAGGIIKPDGTYVLETYKEGDGSMAGEFRVLIFQETVKEGKTVADGSAPGTTVPGSVATVSTADRIPIIYSDGAQSPLKAKIEPKPNEIDFELKRQ